jgi:hypothetical protein
LHTSQEARSEGQQYYTLVNERAPQEGKTTFMLQSGTMSVTVVPSENFRTPRPEHVNKIWINFAVDRFVYQGMKQERLIEISLDDYNFHVEVLDKMRRLVRTFDWASRGAFRKQETMRLLSLPALEESIEIWSNRLSLIAGSSEENVATHLSYQLDTEASKDYYRKYRQKYGLSCQTEIQWATQHLTDLPPCSSSVNLSKERNETGQYHHDQNTVSNILKDSRFSLCEDGFQLSANGSPGIETGRDIITHHNRG